MEFLLRRETRLPYVSGKSVQNFRQLKEGYIKSKEIKFPGIRPFNSRWCSFGRDTGKFKCNG
jgi:hypothetical protein